MPNDEKSLLYGMGGDPSESVAFKKFRKIGCLVESRGMATEVGFAFLDLQTLECTIGQYADTPVFSGLCRQLVIFQPELV